MVKRFFIFLAVICLPFLILAQEVVGETTGKDNGSTEFSMGGGVGSVIIDGTSYSRIRLMPEIAFWKFGFGLDIDLLIDKNGNLRKDDWDEASDIMNKVYYARFAQRGDPFYARVGGFLSYTLGYGLIMRDYSNMLKYPDERQIGLQVGGNIKSLSGLGMEVFTSNLNKNEILAARGEVKPLQLLSLPLLSKISVGAQFVTDRNQYGGIEDKDGDKVPDGLDPFPDDKSLYADSDGDGVADYSDMNLDGVPDMYIDSNADGDIDPNTGAEYIDNNFAAQNLPANVYNPGVTEGTWDTDVAYNKPPNIGKKLKVTIVGLDYTLPLIGETGDKFTLGHYGEVAKIDKYGTGFIFPGFYSKLLIFDINVEMRHFGDKFLPNYFDNMYDQTRAVVQDSAIVTKEQMLEYTKAQTGWYGCVNTNLFNMMFFKIAYQDMYGDDVQNGKSLWGTLGIVPKAIPKITTAKISYTQTGVKSILSDWRTPSSLIDGKLGYGMSPNTDLVWLYQERYVDADSNGKIEGNDEILKSMSFGVEFRF